MPFACVSNRNSMNTLSEYNKGSIHCMILLFHSIISKRRTTYWTLVELYGLLFYNTHQMSVKEIFQNNKLLDLFWQEKRGGGWNLNNMHFFVLIHKQFWVVVHGRFHVSCKNLYPKKLTVFVYTIKYIVKTSNLIIIRSPNAPL